MTAIVRKASMTTRRRFLGAAASAAAATTALPSCSTSNDAYARAVLQTWRPFDEKFMQRQALQRELVRYATLAPSSHNTQCWKFRLAHDAISIQPDFARRCSIVDPEDHHLFVSLGCATENIAQAASAHRLQASVRFEPADGRGVIIALESAPRSTSTLAHAIPDRQSTRGTYDGTRLSLDELRALEQAGRGNGVRVLLLTARRDMERILSFVVDANAVQLNDPAFMTELRQWIRFNQHEAVTSGDGLFSGASGSPSVPRWLGTAMLKLLYTPKIDGDKYATNIRSSAGIAVFVSDRSDAQHWVEAGRCFERFALQATALNVRTAMLNQPVEVNAIRPQFAAALELGMARPDLVVRFGHGPCMPRSLRRPLGAVII